MKLEKSWMPMVLKSGRRKRESLGITIGRWRMQWIILIGDERFDLNKIKAIEHYGSIDSYDVPEIEGRYCVDFGDDHIFYDFNDMIEDYEKDELNNIPYDNPNFVTVIYTSKNCIRNILKQDDFPDIIYVDNGFGLILPIKEFIELGMPLDENDMKNLNMTIL